MILSDIVEEILEKVGEGPGRSLSMPSIIRKVDQKQKQILRQYGYNNDDVAVMDILTGIVEYPLPCAPGNITSVYVNDQRLPLRQRNDYSLSAYYYLLDGTIGLYLQGQRPTEDIIQGLKIFHKHVPAALAVGTLNAEPEIEEEFRMLLVYGVLIDIAEPAMIGFYRDRYDELLAEYVSATRDPESTQICEVYYP
ncbi:hypothetical protein RB620_04410 [Paenibacillus sp. LHD-117]|uniref:phage adaptor protein n=1 Tax=Paenibacillus sp. LHD-117 TaxID=3071412 RepID=UPI0027DF53B4|nr:hypothetical protein [Paenibacillus sp. LHD-117]MDQ6418675.1 hypothetical protein [Paenibacillus sp. LHD-117]